MAKAFRHPLALGGEEGLPAAEWPEGLLMFAMSLYPFFGTVTMMDFLWTSHN